MKTVLSEQEMVAVLATVSADAMNSFTRAIHDITTGSPPDMMILAAKTRMAFAVQSGRLSQAAELFGISAQKLDGDGFLRLKEAVENLCHA